MYCHFLIPLLLFPSSKPIDLSMAALNPEAPEFYPIRASSLAQHPFDSNPSAPPSLFHPPPSNPSLQPIPQSYYNQPNTPFSSSDLPSSHPFTQTQFHAIHGNLHPTQQPLLPTLSFTTPHVEAQVRGGDGAATELDEATNPHSIALSFSKYNRVKGPRFYRNRGEERQFHAVQGKIWVPKESGKTTFMIKNIPYRYTEEMVLQFLDDYCCADNDKLKREEGQQSENSMSAYDFFYLPIDFRTGCSRGFAFVNFTCESGAIRLRRALNGYKWCASGWNKTCQIAYARIQGKEELEMHFKNSNFYCGKEAYLPVVFHPYRNGSCTFQASRLGNSMPIQRDSNTQGETTELITGCGVGLTSATK